ncbi:MAG: hypothetical protein K0R21_290 [Anaerocolumna sp.]|jgi:hypothetical protein|nr:hypothetical protein [Anaerocolumna sp.]
MNEIYAEAGVKKEKSASVVTIRLIMLFIVVISVALSFINTIALMVAVIFIALTIYFYPKLNVEYEYIYCDGQLDFDKIMGNSRRKTIVRIDFEQVDIMAPEGSHALDNYNNVKTVKDFSSGRKDAKRYVIIAKGEADKIRIIFEPNTNMINCIKTKNHRKVNEY